MIATVLLFTFCTGCPAQEFPFVYYTPHDGLVSSRVRSIKQDDQGRMYFMTFAGLSVYDGARFVNYRVADGLANDLVNDLYEITPDSILVATNTQALNLLYKGSISRFATADGFCPVINRFVKSTDGPLYAAADEGLFVYSQRKWVRVPLVQDRQVQSALFIDQVIEWKNYLLLIPWKPQMGKCVFLYNKITRRVTDILHDCFVSSAIRDGSGQILFATADGVKMLDTARLLGGRIAFATLPQKWSSLGNMKNTALFSDAEDNLWVYSNEMITKIDPAGVWQTVVGSKRSKPGNLLAFYEDREGVIWVASDGKGAAKMKQQNLQLLDAAGDVPLNTSSICNESDTVWMVNNTANAVCRITGNRVTTMRLGATIMGRGDLYWVGRSLYITDQNRVWRVRDPAKPVSFLHPETIVAASSSTSFGLGLTDGYHSIIHLENRNDSAFYLTVIRNDSILSREPIPGMSDQMALDRDGKLWCVTRNNHLLVFSLHPGIPRQYLRLDRDYSSLPFSQPRSLAVDSENRLWIGTRSGGLYKVNVHAAQLTLLAHFTESDGLSDDFVTTLEMDRDNNLWVGTQSGLDRIFRANGHYIISNVSRNNNLFQAVTRIICTPDQTTWAVTNEGSVLKFTYTAPRLRRPPPVFIVLARVNGQQAGYGNTTFSYRENNLEFYVSSPSFIDERSIRFSYLLAGSDATGWSEFTTGNRMNFVNLAPGSYRLLVRAVYPGEIYPVQENRFSFVIAPPWWQTWWFRVTAVAIILAIMLILVRSYYLRQMIRQKSLLEKKQAVEKERTRIATDMHDDLGAGLSRIKFLSETIGIKKQQDLPIDEDIGKIREFAHEMIDKMGEIVWALNEKNDTLTDLLSYTRSYTVEYLGQNGIDCTVDMPAQLPPGQVSGEFRRNIYLTVKEALHNIVKHAQASHVQFRVTVSQHLRIYLADDGIGMLSSPSRPFRNGVTNMHKRISEIGGQLRFTGTAGTVVEIEVPIPS